jgi:HAD superfamily hydrolase (TIGR01509 family)
MTGLNASSPARSDLLSRAAPLRMVIFDCDGVLIDSEPIADRVVARELARLGWTISEQEAHDRFLGLCLPDMPPLIEAELGRQLPATWVGELTGRFVEAMAREATLMQGAHAALDTVDRFGLAWRIASNSEPAELAAKFHATGLTRRVEGRVISAAHVIARGGRGKPAPDLFLLAAEQCGVPPAMTLVIEDSPVGVAGAVAAGMQCLGYDPRGDGAHLRAAGAIPFRSLYELPELLGAALKVRI